MDGVYKYLTRKNLVIGKNLLGGTLTNWTLSPSLSQLLKINEIISQGKYNFILIDDIDYHFGIIEFNNNEKIISKTIQHYHKKRNILFKLEETKLNYIIGTISGFHDICDNETTLLGSIYLDHKSRTSNILYNSSIPNSLNILERLFV